MPLWHIYCPENAYSAEDKCVLATRITDLYADVGLPRFYVSVVFHELPKNSFFVGGKATNDVVRIWIDQIARATAPELRAWWLERVNTTLIVPRKYIFHLGNPEHAMFYPQRLFDWLHWADLVRFGVKTELLAGLALLIGDGSGLLKIPQTASRIADIIRFRETIRAFIVASDDTGFMTPGGMYKPNNLYADFGRAYYQEHAKNIHNEILDLSGRSAIIQPAASDFGQFGSTLDAMLKGAWTNGRERLKVFRVIRDMFLTDWGGRGRMFDQFNGTPLNTIRMLTMMRTEFHPNGPLAAFAREVCDIPLVEGQSTVQQQIADYAKAQDVATT